ncbi:hypothetical protein [Halobacteriovorax sp. RT-2-4]|uniref:hypothetical protein n=1 Tax=unclassified Halobacteriovorax TaxID=2639665 RepID=UPI00399B9C40
MKKFWNTLTYFSPLLLSIVLWFWTSLPTKFKFNDTSFTVSWSISTLAAGFILSNLPQENNWIKKIKELPGVFKRLSLFLMSPTVYGLAHYLLSQLNDPQKIKYESLIFILYSSTIASVVFTILILGFIIHKVHDE